MFSSCAIVSFYYATNQPVPRYLSKNIIIFIGDQYHYKRYKFLCQTGYYSKTKVKGLQF